jgi:hypothetical protein
MIFGSIAIVALVVAVAFGEVEQTGPSGGGRVWRHCDAAEAGRVLQRHGDDVAGGRRHGGVLESGARLRVPRCAQVLQRAPRTPTTLQLDRSTVPNACVLYGSVVLTAGPGYAVMSLYPQSTTTPAFTSTLTEWV